MLGEFFFSPLSVHQFHYKLSCHRFSIPENLVSLPLPNLIHLQVVSSMLIYAQSRSQGDHCKGDVEEMWHYTCCLMSVNHAEKSRQSNATHSE